MRISQPRGLYASIIITGACATQGGGGGAGGGCIYVCGLSRVSFFLTTVGFVIPSFASVGEFQSGVHFNIDFVNYSSSPLLKAVTASSNNYKLISMSAALF